LSLFGYVNKILWNLYPYLYKKTLNSLKCLWNNILKTPGTKRVNITKGDITCAVHHETVTVLQTNIICSDIWFQENGVKV